MATTSQIKTIEHPFQPTGFQQVMGKLEILADEACQAATDLVNEILPTIEDLLFEDEIFCEMGVALIAFATAPLILLAAVAAIVYHFVVYGYSPAELIAKRGILNTHKVTKEIIDPIRSNITFALDGALRIRGGAKKATEFVRINTPDGATLDGVEIHTDQQSTRPAKEQKWVIHLGGRGSCWEKKYDYLNEVAEEAGANILTANYREVGYSRGKLRSKEDLITDARAMVQRLLDKGVDPSNILIWGYSLGGGIGAELAHRMQKDEGLVVNLLSDRSFSSMRDAVSSVVWVPFLRDIASILADRYWKIDALEHFKSLKGRRYVIVDPYDAVMRHEKVSLQGNLEHQRGAKGWRVHYIDHTPQAHTSYKKRFEHLWERHKFRVPPPRFRELISDFLDQTEAPFETPTMGITHRVQRPESLISL